MPAFVATDPEGHEAYPRQPALAPAFVRFSSARTSAFLTSGVGRHLTRKIAAAEASVIGIVLSEPYVQFARSRAAGSGLIFDVGDVLALPYADGGFDRTVSMLALDVLPDSCTDVKKLDFVPRMTR